MSIGKRFCRARLSRGLATGVLMALSVVFCGWQAIGAPLSVVATVGMVADLARGVGGSDVVVQGLMGPGVDPHLYKATSSDLIRLQRAEVILYSGLHLEGKMQETFQRLSQSGRRVRAVTDGLPQERLIRAGRDGMVDPHVWFDVDLWARCADGVASELSAARPESAEGFRQRAATVKEELKALHQWVLDRVATVPASRRILVTSHDAFGYFGRAYGFQVVALQGVSTVTEAGLADMAQLTDFIRSKGVPAVFVESSVSHASLERIRKDAGVKLGGELFSDAMGTPGQKHGGYDLGTYQGMIRQNVDRIVEGLK
jgi:manganese/zinc/iron transport system substrate-binding protein